MVRPEVPNAQDVTDKWSSRTPQAADEMASRAAESSDKWLENAKKGQDNYEQQMRKDEVLKRRLDRLNDDSRSKFQRNVEQVAASRFSSGVRNSTEDFNSGIQGVLDAIASTDLPERGPAMSEANFERVRAVAENVHKQSKQS